MKLREIGETVATLGAATLVGLNALQKKRKEAEEHKNKKSVFRHIAFYSLLATGLALWEIKKHHHHAAA